MTINVYLLKHSRLNLSSLFL